MDEAMRARYVEENMCWKRKEWMRGSYKFAIYTYIAHMKPKNTKFKNVVSMDIYRDNCIIL